MFLGPLGRASPGGLVLSSVLTKLATIESALKTVEATMRTRVIVALSMLCLVALAILRETAASSEPLDWAIGKWRGVRREEATGKSDPLTVFVESLPGGAGQMERLQVDLSD